MRAPTITMIPPMISRYKPVPLFIEQNYGEKFLWKKIPLSGNGKIEYDLYIYIGITSTSALEFT